MITTTTTFQTVKARRERSGKCVKCGKRTRRSRTFEHSINPWNKNKDGGIKNYNEVHANVNAQADVWLETDLMCAGCEDVT